MTSHVISRLEALIGQKVCWVESLHNTRIHPTKDQYHILETLSLDLSRATTDLPLQIEALRRRRTESEDGRKLIAQAVSVRRNLIATGTLKNRKTFGRNITFFFEGPKDSALDSEAVKARKRVTRERCERISGLCPNLVISWAVAFTPSLWTANLMSGNTFDHIIEHMEPMGSDSWPPEIYKILCALRTEEPLQGLNSYHEFMKGVVYS